MAKQNWKASTLLNPVPLVMVSCVDEKNKPNIITLAWAGTINSEPPMLSISIRPERHSYNIIKESGEFVTNLVTKELTYASDFCGVKSGRDIDKFTHLGLTPEKAVHVNAPLIKESPINLECKVTQIIPLGTHDLFLAQIKSVNVDEKLLDESGKLCLYNADLVCYSHGEYFQLGELLGYYGYSVTKDKKILENRLNRK